MCLDMRRIVKVGPYWYRAIDLYYWVYQCVVCEVHPSLYLLTSYHTIANMAQSINHCGILTWKKYLSNMVTNTDSNIPTYSLSIFFNTQNKNKTKKHLPCDPLKNLQKNIFKNMYFCFWTHFVYNSLLLLWQFLCFSSELLVVSEIVSLRGSIMVIWHKLFLQQGEHISTLSTSTHRS